MLSFEVSAIDIVLAVVVLILLFLFVTRKTGASETKPRSPVEKIEKLEEKPKITFETQESKANATQPQTSFQKCASLRLIGSKGTVKVVGVGVYWDANCNSPVYSLDWGSVLPVSVKNVTVFIRNEGNEPSTLFLATENWKPSNASNFIILNWDYDRHLIYPQQTTKVTLTLSVVSNTNGIKDFNFDIIIGVNG